MSRAARFVATGLVLCAVAVALAACVVEVKPMPSLAPPDATQPVAGICLDPQPGGVATFTFAIDTPQPRCGKVLPAQQLRLVNATGSRVTITWMSSYYHLDPGATQTFDGTFGVVWRPGVHFLQTSAYAGGGGPEIWLVAN